MTTFLLIRHASHDWLGRGLAGRKPGVFLNERGHEEARALGRRLAAAQIRAFYASPMERAQETAALLTKGEIHIEHGFDEVDFGEWMGRSFEEVKRDPHWPMWVERRSEARPPGGESLAEIGARTSAALTRLTERHDGETIAIVSHGDVIKTALAVAGGWSFDRFESWEIAPASVSVLACGADWAQVRLVNDTGAFCAPPPARARRRLPR